MILDTIKNRIRVATLSKNIQEKNLLKVVLGESQTLESRKGSITDEEVLKLVKKMAKNNVEFIKALEIGKEVVLKTDIQNFVKGTKGKISSCNEVLFENGTKILFESDAEFQNIVEIIDSDRSKRQETLKQENEIFSSLFPKQMTVEEIRDCLSKNPDIKNARSDGQAFGVASKSLENQTLIVDEDALRNIIKEVRNV